MLRNLFTFGLESDYSVLLPVSGHWPALTFALICLNFGQAFFVWDPNFVQITDRLLPIYYWLPTFWQFKMLWFVFLKTKCFQAQNHSGSCLNYLIHDSNFYLIKIESVVVAIEKETTFWQNVTKCHLCSDSSTQNSISDKWSDEAWVFY